MDFRTHEVWIPTQVEEFFAASPNGPLLEVGPVSRNHDSPVSASLRNAIDRVPSAAISDTLDDEHFLGFHGNENQEEQERIARESIVVGELERRIQHRRRSLLLSQYTIARPPPYDDPALADLPITEDLLVPMSEFDIEEGVLLRNGRAFVVLPPTPSQNSSYWITGALASSGCREAASIRLDPLIRGDAETFPRMAYRMLWWGPPLRWDDVVSIEDEKFGRWAPGLMSSAGEFTDFAWVPRRDEQHLFLEEVPKREELGSAGSRYFHVIFSRTSKSVIHLDGAIRIYSEREWDSRGGAHVHRAGKVGVRIKVFRIDDVIEPSLVSSLGATFFVWNYDVSDFFGAQIPLPLLGNSIELCQ